MRREKLPVENPELAAQWDYDKNGNLRPEDFTGGSNKKVWWRCALGHSWEAQINKRFTFGRGCPYCSGNKVLPGFNDLHTTHPHVAAQWDYAKNGGLKPEQFSIGADVRIWWKCELGHTWAALLYSRKQCGCPVCAGNIFTAGINDLQTVNPILAEEWDTVKNGHIRPDSVAANDNRKAWWRCVLGHSWRAVISSRHRGRGCPFCRHRKVLSGFNDLLTVAPAIAAEWNYAKNAPLYPEMFMPASSKSVWWRCAHGHSWKTAIAARYGGHGCPYCAGKLAIAGDTDLKTLRPDLCAQWDSEKNHPLTPEQMTGWSSKKVWWLCNMGHSYTTTIANRNRGNGCPYCAGKLPIHGETDFRTVHPELIGEWDFEKNGHYLPEDFTAASHKKVWWRCDNGHSWKTAVFNRHNGSGCPVCALSIDRHPVLTGVTDLASVYPILAEEWDYERNSGLTPRDILPHSMQSVWWVCKRGHHWKTKVQARVQGTGCPYCKGKTPMKTRLVK